MNTARYFVFFFAICISISGYAQELAEKDIFIPLEIQRAYVEGTRSLDGKPGPNYWQNEASYQIDVRVAPEEKMIYGVEMVEYANNSPNELNQIVVRLLYDIYKKGSPRDDAIAASSITDGVVIDSIAINGKAVNLGNRRSVRRSGTNMRIFLDEALPPGGKLSFYCEWSEPIPPSMDRVGTFDASSFFIGYWYPQIAVYDDIDGWDTYDFRGLMEFYGDLADFDVTIELPPNYVVWATGELQNGDTFFPEFIQERISKARQSTERVPIITAEDLDKGLDIPAGKWHFEATKVTDFAMAISDHFLWDACSFPLEDRSVFISTVYPKVNKDRFDYVTDLQADIMKAFSEDYPGIPYPYPAFTTVNMGFGGGMEFPMMANNGAIGSKIWTAGLTAHEMYHMYHPFYVRINEKKYAWMDEGWADYITDLALSRVVLEENDFDNRKAMLKSSVQSDLGRLSNVPLITSSEYTSNDNYGSLAYNNGHLVYLLLHDLLGEEVFVACLQAYIKRWAYKSPTPYDFFFTFEEVSGKDLSWFWNPWFFEFGYPDLGLTEVQEGMITVKKLGNKPVPVELSIFYADGTHEKIKKSITVWETGRTELQIKTERKELPEKVLLNSLLPDVKEFDNFYIPEDIRKVDTRFLGDYQSRYGIEFKISEKEGLLEVASSFSNDKQILLPVSDTKFESLDGEITVAFFIAGGEVKEMKIESPWQNFVAKKQ